MYQLDSLSTELRIDSSISLCNTYSQTVPQKWEVWEWGIPLTHHVLLLPEAMSSHTLQWHVLATGNSCSGAYGGTIPVQEVSLEVPFLPAFYSPWEAIQQQGQGTGTSAPPPPGQACVRVRKQCSLWPATTGHSWVPCLLTRFSSELAALLLSTQVSNSRSLA